jgi:hypothetical protein
VKEAFDGNLQVGIDREAMLALTTETAPRETLIAAMKNQATDPFRHTTIGRNIESPSHRA